MSSKRSAGTELNHENWDEECEKEEAGTFKEATEEELKARVIKKARRRLTEPKEEGTKSIFSTFSGFKTATVSTESKFSFLSNLPSSSTLTDSSEKSETSPKMEIKTNILNLNKEFVKWLNSIIHKQPDVNLANSLTQYQEYLEANFSSDELKNLNSSLDKFELVNKDKVGVEIKTPSNDKKEVNIKTATNNKKTVDVTIDKEQKDEEFKPTHSPKERINIFSNIKFPVTFGNTSENNSTSTFDFSNFKSSNYGNVEANVEIEQSVEPPKPEFKLVVEEKSVYSKRCKVFFKTDSGYVDRGVGTLYLKPVENSEKTQLIVRADTNLGNILLNFILNKLPTQRMGKNNVVISGVPLPEDPQKTVVVLIRVKTEEDADELFENINKYKK